jgi:S-adenosylmethionine:tRNA ribosyltransferase-isomerase
MLTSVFDFQLPQELIALRPSEPRDSARLMVVKPDGSIEHCLFRDLGRYLADGDILSINDTKVLPARLTGRRPSRTEGAPEVTVEVTLCRRTAPDRFQAFAKPARRLRRGDRLDFAGLSAQVHSRTAGDVELVFDCCGPTLDRAIARIGAMPLPPYIVSRRPPDAHDTADYQTVYAVHEGSVAAPTAGLHFTPQLLESLRGQGIDRTSVTLHVGTGTFLPVASADTADHIMHAEQAVIDAEAAARLNAARAAGGRIVAVGTTVLRTLESAADGCGHIAPFDSDTSIFITPGYRFRTVDMLLTNFHLPRSTLFMLVSAFMGLDVMQAAYAEAIRHKYRFYSYGDACLLVRPS